MPSTTPEGKSDAPVRNRSLWNNNSKPSQLKPEMAAAKGPRLSLPSKTINVAFVRRLWALAKLLYPSWAGWSAGLTLLLLLIAVLDQVLLSRGQSH